MEEKNTVIRNAIASLVCPIRIEGKNIYGIIYDKDKNNNLNDFISYLTAAADFVYNGGQIRKDTWFYNNSEYKIKVNRGFRHLIGTLYSNRTLYITDCFDEQLKYTLDEVDDDCFITSPTLFARYISPIYIKKTVSYDEEDRT